MLRFLLTMAVAMLLAFAIWLIPFPASPTEEAAAETSSPKLSIDELAARVEAFYENASKLELQVTLERAWTVWGIFPQTRVYEARVTMSPGQFNLQVQEGSDLVASIVEDSSGRRVKTAARADGCLYGTLQDSWLGTGETPVKVLAGIIRRGGGVERVELDGALVERVTVSRSGSTDRFWIDRAGRILRWDSDRPEADVSRRYRFGE